ncbi:Nitroreductase-like protein [Pyrenochaeta sp. MPI-SDFR-AT-0127]|nr:Nitroreductase-like protein [Pyrenochaeta sp. MPI-SDFR-AT-0127]
MASTTPFFDAVINRRTIYTLANTSRVPQSRITEIVHQALKYCPSAFNVRTCRCIILFGEEHTKLWDHAAEVTPKVAPAELQDLLVPRIGIFRAAYGTVLFFDDQSAYTLLPPHFRTLLEHGPEAEEHASGIVQFTVWTALAAEGLGCNLQHYNPGITPWVKETYNVPDEWKLKCQLVFGDCMAGAMEEPARTHLEAALRTYGGNGEYAN